MLATYRPVDLVVTNHPLKAAKQELVARGQGTEIVLRGLDRAAVQSYVTQRWGTTAAPEEIARFVHQRTEGHPLFMVQVIDYLVQRDRSTTPLAADLTTVAQSVPQGLRELIEAQLGRLTGDEQGILTVGSVSGTEFTVASVAAGMAQAEAAIEALCDRLASRGQFIEEYGVKAWPDGTVSGRYGFRHALYHEVLYARMPEARRVRLHRTIGERLERGYGERAHEIAAELAVHFIHGHDAHCAVSYLQTAADTALRRHAYAEAIGLLTQALEMLQAWPDTPTRVQQELALQVALGTPLFLTKGQASPEVDRTYHRARELCQQVGDTPQLVLVLLGLWRFHSNRAQYQIANELAEQFLGRAQSVPDTVRLAHAHAMQAQTMLLVGEFTRANEHAEQGLALYDPLQHRSQLAL